MIRRLSFLHFEKLIDFKVILIFFVTSNKYFRHFKY